MSHTFSLKPWDCTLLMLKPWKEQKQSHIEHKPEWLDHVHRQNINALHIPCLQRAARWARQPQRWIGCRRGTGESKHRRRAISPPALLGQGLMLSWLRKCMMQLVPWEGSAGWVQEEVGELQIRRKQGHCEKQDRACES